MNKALRSVFLKKNEHYWRRQAHAEKSNHPIDKPEQ
jgi:hypothetical protein